MYVIRMLNKFTSPSKCFKNRFCIYYGFESIDLFDDILEEPQPIPETVFF